LSGIAVKDLLEAGVHFGHQTKRWNPKMKSYIFGERNGIYILDLAKTARRFSEAEAFITSLAASGRTLLFVGTKRQAQDVISEEAQRCGMYFVNQRWLGGLLTNFTTIQRSLTRLRDLEAMVTDGRYEHLSKKEIAGAEKEKRKLLKNLEGIRNMSRLPDAIFVVDTGKEKIAVDEARKLKIPVIGIVDTNCDPDEVDHVIPGNDDALRSIRLFASKVADAVINGRMLRESRMADEAASQAEESAAADAAARLTRAVRPQRRVETAVAAAVLATGAAPASAAPASTAPASVPTTSAPATAAPAIA
jgi:small subunit ribosomal protein S2